MITLQKMMVPAVPVKKEYLLVTGLLCLFLLSPRLLRSLDVTAAPLDPGILSVILVAVLVLLLFQWLTGWLLAKGWPVFGEYSREHFERNFKSLVSWQKVIIYLCFYLCLLFAFVATLAALV